MKLMIRAVVLCLVVVAIGLTQDRASSTTGEINGNSVSVLEKMPQSLEVRFALSALPQFLRNDATVYVLDPARGYSLARQGNNGQSCFVERTEWKKAEYREDIYTPICYDSAGAKSQMQVYFDVAELRAKGISAATVKKEIEAKFADGIYKAPSRAGFSYMVAPIMRTSVSPDPNNNGPGLVFVRMRDGLSAAAGRADMQRITDAANKALAADPNAAGTQVAILGVQRPAEIVNFRTMGSTPILPIGR